MEQMNRGLSDGFSIFIDNIPLNLDQFGLRGIFRKAGRVKDSYIPKNQRRSLRRYGFVRFWRVDDARRSVRLLNNRMI